MKNLIHILLVVLAISGVCCSCGSSDAKHEYIELGNNLDFGKGTYRPNPFKILDDIPPFSWMGMPDSVKKTTELVISFNEDAMRSKSTAQLALVDLNGNKIEGIQVDKPNGDIFSLKADTVEFIIPVSFTVNPNIGDSVLKGSIMVLGADLDEANGISLGTTMTPIATWSLEHKTDINWWRWILLIIIAVVALYIIFVIGCLIYGATSVGIETLSGLSVPSFGFNLNHPMKKRSKKNRKTNTKNTDLEEDNDGNYVKEIAPNCFRINRKYIIPTGSQHKNPQGMTCGQILDALNDESGIIRLMNGEPYFDKDGGTKNGRPLKASFPEGIDSFLKPQELQAGKKINRNKLHNEAFKRIAKSYGMDEDELQVFKGNSGPVEKLMRKWNCSEQEVYRRCNNPQRIARVLHECKDGKTVLLVPWVYHHIPHTGGIEAVAARYK